MTIWDDSIIVQLQLLLEFDYQLQKQSMSIPDELTTLLQATGIPRLYITAHQIGKHSDWILYYRNRWLGYVELVSGARLLIHSLNTDMRVITYEIELLNPATSPYSVAMVIRTIIANSSDSSFNDPNA